MNKGWIIMITIGVALGIIIFLCVEKNGYDALYLMTEPLRSSNK